MATRWHACAGVAQGSSAWLRALCPPNDKSKDVTVIELRMPNRKGSYTAGQWVFVCLPRLGLLHWHPFTIASASGDEELSLYVGAGGKWTNRLADLAARKETAKARTRARAVPCGGGKLTAEQLSEYCAVAAREPTLCCIGRSYMTLVAMLRNRHHALCPWQSEVQGARDFVSCAQPPQVYVEGPYGAPMIDLHGSRYKCVLIICSGLGWTYGRAMKRQLLADAVRGRPLKSLRSVAVAREQTASALDACWGWDLREDEGEAWPPGLRALVRCA
jgi:FAD-binding domain